MATLNPSNVINGNTIQASDIAQLYKAFGTGSGATITGLSLTGSITNANLATSSISSISASAITTTITGSGTHFLTFVDQAGTRPPRIASLLEYTADTNNLTVTASFATNYTNPTLIEGIVYSGSIQTPNLPFKFIAGINKTDGSSNVVVNISQTAGKIYGQSLFIVATTSEVGVGTVNVQTPVTSPNITFQTTNPNTDFTYQIIYI